MNSFSWYYPLIYAHFALAWVPMLFRGFAVIYSGMLLIGLE